MRKPDRVALEDLDRIGRLIDDLRRFYPVAVENAEDVPMTSGVEGPGRRVGSHADPTATAALDGRRKRRRDSVRRSRNAIAASLRQLQEASFHAYTAADG